jgi:murein DD-endopeptidase MepM/ murein hydrolase activator NlpD
VPITTPGIQEPVTCTGKPQAPSAPFLQSPYRGYAEVATYFDHDQPDYAIDGKIVLTTGLVVTGNASGGRFPDYWSPQLRQWINYDGHNGYDYDIIYQPVRAAAAGVVTYAAWESSDPDYGYGQMILIKHAHGYMTLYGHFSKLEVKPGQHVKAGQVIGISGSTGNSSGPHLHFTVYHNCHAVDPYGWNGKGKDPLVPFNGETSTYLWLNGEAPDILNPLPGWPTFQTGDRIMPGASVPVGGPSSVRPVVLSHLLLLRLPTPNPGEPATDLASFNQQVSDEQERVVQVLKLLEKEHLVTSYRPVPAAGAIQVRGKVPAAQLIDLPGVASIVGDRPADVTSAIEGLNHALIGGLVHPEIQTSFPSTYLDAASSWQLSVSAEENGPYVLGFTQKGAPVHVRDFRDGKVVGRLDSRGDAETGAFAGSILNSAGGQLTIRAGDRVRVSSESQFTTVNVLPLTVAGDAATSTLSGAAPSGARLSVIASESVTGTVLSASAVSSTHYSTHVAGTILPGDHVGVSVVNANGDRIFAIGNVTGFAAAVHTSLAQGWEKPGSRWKVTVFAKHGTKSTEAARADASGYLAFHLSAAGRPYSIKPGNHLVFRSLSHSATKSWLAIDDLTATVKPPTHVTHVFVRLWNETTGTFRMVPTAGHTRAKILAATSRLRPGESAEITYTTPTGSDVQQSLAGRAVMFHGDGEVSGQTGLSQTLVLRAYSPNARLLGTGLTGTSTGAGLFDARIFNHHGSAIHLRAGDIVTLSDGLATTRRVVPALHAFRSIDGRVLSGSTSLGGKAVVTIAEGSTNLLRRSAPIRHGVFRVRIPAKAASVPGATMTVTVGSAQSGGATLGLHPISKSTALKAFDFDALVFSEPL